MMSKQYREKVKSYLDEMIYGANDGIITTFAVVSSATGATLGGDTIIILGVANLIADGFSMGASSFLSIKTQEDVDGTRMMRMLHLKKKSDAVVRSLVTFGSFVCAGFIPLIPFLQGIDPTRVFFVSSISAGFAFFSVGALRSIVTRRGFLMSGLEMMCIGGIAATLAYGVGHVVHSL